MKIPGNKKELSGKPVKGTFRKVCYKKGSFRETEFPTVQKTMGTKLHITCFVRETKSTATANAKNQ